MLSSGTDGYTWDARNQLVSTLSGASFQYDTFGRRVSKTISGSTTNYLYDGVNLAQELSGGVPTAKDRIQKGRKGGQKRTGRSSQACFQCQPVATIRSG